MFAISGLRAFSVSVDRNRDGVSCGPHGVYVGDIPLLARKRAGAASEIWTVRPFIELNDELTACYRLPVDVATKAGALSLIATALNRGDIAMAAIAAVQMQFPDPPPLVKCAESIDALMRRGAELYRSGLLKADWDPTKHPRTGTPPNRGWFAPVPKEEQTPRRTGWPLPRVNELARQFVELAGGFIERNEGRILLLGLKLNPWIEGFLAGFTPEELNQGEDRLIAQLNAALQQQPQSLGELQQQPIDNSLGYEQHHIVEQNPDNLEKIIIAKFGQERLDDPSNLVWLPRFQHEEISAYYSSKLFGPGGPTVREIISVFGYEQQREVGLSAMRKFGVLK